MAKWQTFIAACFLNVLRGGVERSRSTAEIEIPLYGRNDTAGYQKSEGVECFAGPSFQCHAQQTLFGKQAFEYITYVECDEEGINPQPQACRAAGVESYPTWNINGETYSGVQSLQSLAAASNYSGSQNFAHQSPGH